jgi:hypothetical protein
LKIAGKHSDPVSTQHIGFFYWIKNQVNKNDTLAFKQSFSLKWS